MANKIKHILINLLLAIVIGTLLLIGVFLLPTDSIDKHVKESAYILANEEVNIKVFDWCTSNLDNFTDSLMLLEAANDNNHSLIVKAMGVYRIDYIDETIGPYNTLIKHYVNNEDNEILTSYERYWHGYLIFLKPLLMIMNYGGIRILNLILQTLLTIILCISMYKNNLKKYIISYVISYLMLMPYVISLSLQYSTCFYIFTIALLVMVNMNKDKLKKYNYLIFLNIGISVAYFDYLTYPLVTLGIPLLFYLSIKKDEINIKSVISLCLYWAIGYLGMWAAKWILGDIFTNETVIKDTINQILIRTSNTNDGVTYSLFDCIYTNYALFLATPFKYVLFIYLVYLIYRYIEYAYTNKYNLINKELLIYLLIAFFPIIWFMFTINHSIIHGYLFVNKIVVLTFISAMFYLKSYNN